MPSYDDGSTHPPANAFDPRFLELLGERDEPPTARGPRGFLANLLEAAGAEALQHAGTLAYARIGHYAPRYGTCRPSHSCFFPLPGRGGPFSSAPPSRCSARISPSPPAVVASDLLRSKGPPKPNAIALRKEICFKPPVTTGFSLSFSYRLLTLVNLCSSLIRIKIECRKPTSLLLLRRPDDRPYGRFQMPSAGEVIV